MSIKEASEAPYRSPWLQRLRPCEQPAMRLICLPFAGGSALAYKSWSSSCDAQVDLLGVQLPGRGHRMHEPCMTEMSGVLDSLEQALGPYLDRPFALFGHSMGAIIAYELARRLRHAPLMHLFVSGRNAPNVRSARPLFHQLDDDALLAAVGRFQGIPEVVLADDALRRKLLLAFRADFTLLERWQTPASSPLHVPVTAFGGRADDCASEAGLRAWASLSSSRFELRMFDGGHFYFQPDASRLVKAMQAAFAQSEVDRGRLRMELGS